MFESAGLVLRHSRAVGTDKVVLITIASHEGDGGSWPAIQTLADCANVSVRSVQASIRRLEEMGELRVHRQAGGTLRTRADRRPNFYEVLVECPPDCDHTKFHRRVRSPDDGVKPTAPRSPGHGMMPTTPRSPGRGEVDDTPSSPRGEVERGHGVKPTSPEEVLRKQDLYLPVVDPPYPPTASAAPTAVSRQAQIDVVFKAWRCATGRTDATKLDGKRTALIARQLRLYSVEDLCDAVRGWRHFPHNRGETNGTRYDGLELCLRDAEHIERFRDAERGTAATPELTGMARIRAMTNAPPAAPQRFGQVIDVAAS